MRLHPSAEPCLVVRRTWNGRQRMGARWCVPLLHPTQQQQGTLEPRVAVPALREPGTPMLAPVHQQGVSSIPLPPGVVVESLSPDLPVTLAPHTRPAHALEPAPSSLASTGGAEYVYDKAQQAIQHACEAAAAAAAAAAAGVPLTQPPPRPSRSSSSSRGSSGSGTNSTTTSRPRIGSDGTVNARPACHTRHHSCGGRDHVMRHSTAAALPSTTTNADNGSSVASELRSNVVPVLTVSV